MSEGMLAGLGFALWLGLLTAISPCPLTTNVAAMSFVGRRVGSTRSVLAAGAAYTLGRTLAYVILGVVVAAGLVAAPGLSVFLQTYGNKLLGPGLVLVGMVLLEMLVWDATFGLGGEGMKAKAGEGGAAGAAALGFVFALSFCPPSAALFFGSLVPLAVRTGSTVLLPLVYGVGTGLPVLVFAVALARGAGAVASAFGRIQAFEWWARRVTGVVFVGAGVYYSLVYVWRVL